MVETYNVVRVGKRNNLNRGEKVRMTVYFLLETMQTRRHIWNVLKERKYEAGNYMLQKYQKWGEIVREQWNKALQISSFYKSRKTWEKSVRINFFFKLKINQSLIATQRTVIRQKKWLSVGNHNNFVVF